ncbi:hypothetical protein [Chitinophaga silvisoli]|uniref:Uncharacterized protein n=1 Tax=Chitinophaga silvisoli TaxID=2291814 RepID=A0A3E1P2K6_9BACT|nr:hypothetical protein [Chitinophaga silvisoli]RFM34419.1 hypothetical protein DXN04_14150 [Chitinophaga silvisoli]
MDNVQNELEINVGHNLAVLEDTVRIRQLPETVLDTLPEQMATGKPEIKTYGLVGFEDVSTVIGIEATFYLIENKYYLNRTQATVAKEIEITHGKIGDLNTADLESRLANPPTAEFRTSENSTEYDLALENYQSKITQDLLVVQKEKPEIFNRLIVKYHPDVDIQMDKTSLDRQARIDADHNKTFEFSDYYKLTTMEMFNLLEGRAVYKTLKQYNFVDSEGNIVEGDNLKNRPELRQVSSKFDTWLKLKQQPNGSQVIEFVGGLRNVESQLVKFNFQDMDDANYVDKLAYHIRKGSEVVVKFPNASGSSNLIVAANPPEGLKIANMEGKVLSPVPFLKIQPEKKNFSRPVVTSSPDRQVKNEESNREVVDNQPSQAQQHTGSQTNGNENSQSPSQGVLQQVRSFFSRNRQVGEDNNNISRKI